MVGIGRNTQYVFSNDFQDNKHRNIIFEIILITVFGWPLRRLSRISYRLSINTPHSALTKSMTSSTPVDGDYTL